MLPDYFSFSSTSPRQFSGAGCSRSSANRGQTGGFPTALSLHSAFNFSDKLLTDN
jgi:hypothetical protein